MDVIMTTEHPVPCVDLRATFHGVFRFDWDEAYVAERPEFRAKEAPWLTLIPGRRGRIFPWGGRLLAAYTNNRMARQALETLDGMTVRQGGTVGRFVCPEVIVTFDVDLIDSVAAILQSKRAFRKPPPGTADRIRAYRFSAETAAAKGRSVKPDSTNEDVDEEIS